VNETINELRRGMAWHGTTCHGMA